MALSTRVQPSPRKLECFWRTATTYKLVTWLVLFTKRSVYFICTTELIMRSNIASMGKRVSNSRRRHSRVAYRMVEI